MSEPSDLDQWEVAFFNGAAILDEDVNSKPALRLHGDEDRVDVNLDYNKATAKEWANKFAKTTSFKVEDQVPWFGSFGADEIDLFASVGYGQGIKNGDSEKRDNKEQKEKTENKEKKENKKDNEKKKESKDRKDKNSDNSKEKESNKQRDSREEGQRTNNDNNKKEESESNKKALVPSINVDTNSDVPTENLNPDIKSNKKLSGSATRLSAWSDEGKGSRPSSLKSGILYRAEETEEKHVMESEFLPRDSELSASYGSSVPSAAHAFVETNKGQRLNTNRYATKKTVAQGLLDVALLTSNASQLRTVLLAGDAHPFYTIMLVLIILSIVLQVMVGVLFVVIGALNINEESNERRADIINNVIVAIIVVITGVNIVINGFGVNVSGPVEVASGTTSPIR